MVEGRVGVVTDSAAALPDELAGDALVRVVPMQLTIGERAYRDGDLSLEELLDRVDEGITTAAPTPGEFAEAIAAADAGRGVVVLTVAGTMSAAADAARVAARVAGAEARVVDTKTAAGAEALVVLEAARAAAAGADVDAVEAAATGAVADVRLMATLEDLDRLAKSGRVPEAAASAGKWLHLNPLFEFRSGHARPMRPARSRAAALDRIAASCLRPQDHAPGAALHVAALHALAAEPALELLDKVCAEVTPASSFVAPFSPVMLVHTGPGLAGLAWRWVPG